MKQAWYKNAVVNSRARIAVTLCVIAGCSDTPSPSPVASNAHSGADAGHTSGAATDKPRVDDGGVTTKVDDSIASASAPESADAFAPSVAPDMDHSAGDTWDVGRGAEGNTVEKEAGGGSSTVGSSRVTADAATGDPDTHGTGMPEICAALPLDDEPTSDPVQEPPNGYMVYLAETASLGKQVFHVRINDGAVANAVRLTPDEGLDGFMVSPERPAVLMVQRAGDLANNDWNLTLVDFDESGARASLPLSPFLPNGGPASGYSLGSGSLMLSSSGMSFFDLQSSTIASPQLIQGYSYSSSYGWSGSRLIFSATDATTRERGIFSADPSVTPPVAKLVTLPMVGGIQFAIAPNQERAIYVSESPSGETQWYVVDLTASVPEPNQLTSGLLTSPGSGISAWSPDSRYYAAQIDPLGLVLIDVEQPSSAHVVNAVDATNFTWVTFSPDSQRLVYVASHGDTETTQLYGVALGINGPSAAYPLIRGTEEEQSAYVNQAGLLEWMSDSRYVAYYGQNPEAEYLADAYGCSGQRVPFRSSTNEPMGQGLTVAGPNARRAAFFADYEYQGGTKNQAYVVDIDAQGNWLTPTRISGPDGVGLAIELKFFDSDWLFFHAEDDDRRASLFLAPRDGSTPARLLSDPLDHVLNTYWFADEP